MTNKAYSEQKIIAPNHESIIFLNSGSDNVLVCIVLHAYSMLCRYSVHVHANVLYGYIFDGDFSGFFDESHAADKAKIPTFGEKIRKLATLLSSCLLNEQKVEQTGPPFFLL